MTTGSDYLNRALSTQPSLAELDRRACESMIRYLVQMMRELPHGDLVDISAEVWRRHQARTGGRSK